MNVRDLMIGDIFQIREGTGQRLRLDRLIDHHKQGVFIVLEENELYKSYIGTSEHRIHDQREVFLIEREITPYEDREL